MHKTSVFMNAQYVFAVIHLFTHTAHSLFWVEIIHVYLQPNYIMYTQLNIFIGNKMELCVIFLNKTNPTP